MRYTSCSIMRFRHSPFLRAVVVPVTLMSFLSACHKWSTVSDPVAATLADKRPERVQVTTSDGEKFILEAPYVRGDSLIGSRTDAQWQLQTASIELTDVASAQVWQPATAEGTEARWIETPAPIEQLCAEQVTQLRLALVDGQSLILGSPRVEDGRLVGETSRSQWVISLEDVERVERRTGNTAATLAIVGGVVVVVGVLGTLLIVESGRQLGGAAFEGMLGGGS